jgi:DNA-directed RNA polymerase specialized sigma24 family protein
VRTVTRSPALHPREQWFTQRGELAALILRAAAGDQGAFAAFYDATSSLVFGMAHSVFCDQSKAETVTHDIYVAAWISASTFDPSHQPPGAWLQSLTKRNLALVLASEERQASAG